MKPMSEKNLTIDFSLNCDFNRLYFKEITEK